MTLDELDKLAAEKVIGWEINEHPKNAYPAYWGRDTSARWLTDWQPTRNISQAFECLEKLNPKYFDISKTEYAGSPMYVVSLAGTEVGSYDTKATDKDIAICIVRACLRAKGVEV